MPSTTQHGSRVVYVAGPSADLPDLIQAWLNEHPVQESKDIYDALAILTARQRPVALIVNIEAVDWHEMDFFDIAARLSRETRIYVVGQEYHRAKLDAAIASGARRFSPGDLADDLARPAPGSQRVGVRDLLAGSLRTPAKPHSTPHGCFADGTSGTRPGTPRSANTGTETEEAGADVESEPAAEEPMPAATPGPTTRSGCRRSPRPARAAAARAGPRGTPQRTARRPC